MDIVYNSRLYAILAYPVQQGFELIDKAASRSLFVQGSLARNLRKAIDEIPADQRSEESIDALLDAYCAGAAGPMVLH